MILLLLLLRLLLIIITFLRFTFSYLVWIEKHWQIKTMEFSSICSHIPFYFDEMNTKRTHITSTEHWRYSSLLSGIVTLLDVTFWWALCRSFLCCLGKTRLLLHSTHDDHLLPCDIYCFSWHFAINFRTSKAWNGHEVWSKEISFHCILYAYMHLIGSVS